MSDIKDKILKRVEAEENAALEKCRAEDDLYRKDRSKLIETTADKIYHIICNCLEHGGIYYTYNYSGLLFNHTINKRFAMAQLLIKLHTCNNKIDFSYNDVGDSWGYSTWVLTYSSQDDLDSIISRLNQKLLDSEIYVYRRINPNSPIFPSEPRAGDVLSNKPKWWTDQSGQTKYNFATVTFLIFLE